MIDPIFDAERAAGLWEPDFVEEKEFLGYWKYNARIVGPIVAGFIDDDHIPEPLEIEYDPIDPPIPHVRIVQKLIWRSLLTGEERCV